LQVLLTRSCVTKPFVLRGWGFEASSVVIQSITTRKIENRRRVNFQGFNQNKRFGLFVSMKRLPENWEDRLLCKKFLLIVILFSNPWVCEKEPSQPENHMSLE
jgi:hypothetical protein